MTGKGRVVDLAAVARIRGELAELVQAHPELTAPKNQARLETWLNEHGEKIAMDEDGKLNALLNLRVEADVIERCEVLAAGLPFGRPAIIRAALRLGVAALEKDAALLLSPEAMPRKATPKRKRGK